MEDKKEFNQLEYISNYNKEKYKTYNIRVKKALQNSINEYCQKYDKSINGLFVEAIKNYIGYIGE